MLLLPGIRSHQRHASTLLIISQRFSILNDRLKISLYLIPCLSLLPPVDGAVMPSWFDIHEIPVTADSPKDESSVLKAVQDVHAMLDKEIAAGTDPNNVFVCGFSQGGALTLASVLMYPKTLGGGAVFSGWIPFNSSIIERISPNAKRTPFLWSHGMDDRTVLFEAGQAGPPFLEKAGVSCEFKAYPSLGHSISSEELRYLESWIKTRLQSSS
ncbi:probable carboxylesterase SOBER1-like isoform X3 [Carya illinoinensis]|uniref:probable carboxylesterase SOBER1-like isoform X3 n=1 Tax=Carya illinoinensis TaxID=32201 RepID=UPI001C72768A|nr:probable carboxylesterase SOBER1-like isoform X3 [Carya illinoinensis]